MEQLQRVAPQLSRASDLLLVGCAAALVLVDVAIWATDPEVDTGRLSVSIALLVPCLGVLATVAIAVRPRRSAPALAMLAACSTILTMAVWVIGTSLPPSFAALLVLAVLATGVVRREREAVAVPLAALAAVAVAAEALRPRVGPAGYLLVVCEGALAAAVAAGIYLRWSDWRREAAAAAARSGERLEIARELHDLVGHHVTGIVVQAQAARHVSKDREGPAALALASIEAAGTDALLSMHQMVGALRHQAGAIPAGTWEDIDELIAAAVARGEPVRATIDPAIRHAPATLVPSIHRIVAESLTNITRHGRGVTCIELEVVPLDGCLVVAVRDDGTAASSIRRPGFGLIGMEERVASLGGSLVAGPGPAGGWSVRAEIPMEVQR